MYRAISPKRAAIVATGKKIKLATARMKQDFVEQAVYVILVMEWGRGDSLNDMFWTLACLHGWCL
jgi:hypothetical protein